MGKIKVGGLSMLKHAKTLGAALQQAHNGDTIMLQNHREVLDHGFPLETSLYIEGKGKGKTILAVAEHQLGFLLKNGNLDLAHLTIEVAGQANALAFDEGYAGRVSLTDVAIVHNRRIDAREYFPSVMGGTTASPIAGSLVLKDSEVDALNLSVRELSADNSALGDLLRGHTAIYTQSLGLTDTLVNNSSLMMLGAHQRGHLTKVATQGLLTVTGDVTINQLTFKGLDLTRRAVYKQAKRDMSAFEIPGEPFMLAALGTAGDLKTTVTLSGLTVDSSSFELALPNNEPLLQPYWFNVSNSSLTISDTVIPKALTPSRTADSTLTLAKVTDKSQWHTANTVLSNRGSTSELFAKDSDQGDASASTSKPADFGALKQLDRLTGLTNVKTQIHQLVSTAAMNMEREKRGLPVNQDFSMHMVFAGSAGTGKTTVARLFGQALYENGVLKTNKFVEAMGKDLVAGYVGQTAPKTHALVESALDGILFIDEAYSLSPQGANASFNDEAVAQLIADMENNRSRLVVILAGYTPNMKTFFKVGNPGLQSRFANWVTFNDYTAVEMKHILRYQLKGQKLLLDAPNTLKVLEAGLTGLSSDQSVATGNGRFVRNLVQKLTECKDSRLAKQGIDQLSDQALMTITLADVQEALTSLQEKEAVFNGQ